MSGEIRVEWRLWQINLMLLQVWYNLIEGRGEKRSWLNYSIKLVCLDTVLKIMKKGPVHEHCTLVGTYISYEGMILQFWNYISTILRAEKKKSKWIIDSDSQTSLSKKEVTNKHWGCISFLSLLQQITKLVVYNNSIFLYYSSISWKSDMGLNGIKWRSLVTVGFGLFPSLFLLLEATHVPWLMVPFLNLQIQKCCISRVFPA